jgi:tRNA A-37 threonylcarbamoyl transferase component Bud32
MTPERLHQIEELYHAARAQDAGARAAFLAASCGTDAALRREVESLLNQPDALGTVPTASAPSGGSFFFEDLVGRSLGQFRIEGLLRDGGMARVYKGYQESVDRFVAIKVLPRQYANDPRFVERFKQEAHIVAKLHHPHILSVFDHGESDGYTYLAMPFVESGTLADRLSRGPVSIAETSRIIAQVCEALDYAHAQGIVHRDIKPSNILMDAEGNAFVADFGIATILGNTLHLTQTGAFLASPGYCSPEQLTGGEVGSHSDLYAVGMILYEMLTGTTPFQLDGSMASLMKRAHSTVPAPRIRNSNVTAQVEAVVVKALAPSKDDRYATGKELAAALSAALRATNREDATIIAPRDPRPLAEASTRTPGAEAPMLVAPDPVRRRIPMAAWAAAVVALVIVAVLASTMRRRAEPQAPAAATDSSAPSAAAPAPAPEPPAGAAPSAPPSATVKKTEPVSASAAAPPVAARDKAASAPESSTAKQMYDAPASAENVSPGLKYRLVHQRGSSEADADPSTTFHSGDRVRFAFESNIDGYLYVVQAGSSGRWTVLFPNPDANNGRNVVARSEEYLVPDNGWFAFDETPGTEEVFVVLSKQPLETLPGFKTAVTRRETVDRSIVSGLQARIQPRDLLFEKDQSLAADGKTHQVTYVVNRGELASQVAALIQLTHAK